MKNMKLWDWVVWNQRLKKWKIKNKKYRKNGHKIFFFFFFFVCMYKMVVEITKETCEKCGIKTVKYYS